jgi:hypothetical protein|mmetsp:Transcript_36279/g.58275  ORF Transcript_36279/g.58275 Transcript_36279/m.58275 type:complete len:85 (-) Transcript_36279:258-512(-)|eukprot:CAMPEP_0181355068 /NCGR_PEP_ID=MMETSP1106-20121128/3697_1 /TAXON_ID=81844 /ORGANISM="Mantoniella antarctica, Strain SL-175" /LENGTH=84 /DNA_ID=CAMNT_0023467773 /DNA_START=283 /DNA_END=537 /DNA_ORIENTATION=-
MAAQANADAASEAVRADLRAQATTVTLARALSRKDQNIQFFNGSKRLVRDDTNGHCAKSMPRVGNDVLNIIVLCVRVRKDNRAR